ncbi:hypothetical protein [Phnomibacter sp. MR]|uniref:hypothetical protein n=1 Tax=Phnomibacter sp. MR TaxID=3042318 RepID=UPI003A7F9000
MKAHHWAIAISTLYLIVYTVLVEVSASLLLLSALFAGSSIVIIWVAVAILKAPYQGRELAANEEYGYSDRRKENMGFLW